MSSRTTKARAVKRRRGSIIEVQGAHGVAYKLKFDLPTGEKGERRTHYKTIKGTREEAEAELARLTGQAGRGVDLKAGQQTLSSWIEEWLEHHVGDDVSTRTFERYAELLHHYVVPEIGDYPLAVLGVLHIERLYKKLAKSGRRRPSKNSGSGLSPRTILHVHRVLSQCLRDAKRFRLIPDNPMADVKRRKVKGQAADAAQMHVLSLDRILKLFEIIRAANLKSVPLALAVLAFDSGARRGELLALRWSDVDLDGRTVRIDRTVDDTKENGVTIKPEPKNESSRRTITLSAETITTLRAWRASQLEGRLKLGAHLPPDALIFPVSIETPTVPVRPRNVTKAFSWLVAREGFDGFRFHDFRHSCASHLLERGVPVPKVSKHLGHSSPQVTMTIYAHAIPDGDGGMGLLDRLREAAAE